MILLSLLLFADVRSDPEPEKMPASAIIGIVIASLAAAATIALCFVIFFKGRAPKEPADLNDDIVSESTNL